MRFLSKSKKNSSSPPPPPPPSAFGEKPEGGDAGVTRQRPVSIPASPVVQKQADGGDFGDGLWKEHNNKRRSTIDGGPAPISSSLSKDSGDGLIGDGSNDHRQTTSSSSEKHGAKPTARRPSTSRASKMGSNIADGGSTFINGPGTTGPNAQPDVDEDEIAERTGYAEGALTEKEKRNIERGEVKEGKRLTKIIKNEAKVEKEALSVAIKELSQLQQLQREAVKREDKSHTTHTRYISTFNKHEVAFHAARAKYETARAELNALGESLEGSRKAAREATAAIQGKMKEVECLRTTMGVDERERGVKMAELSRGKSLTGRQSLRRQ